MITVLSKAPKLDRIVYNIPPPEMRIPHCQDESIIGYPKGIHNRSMNSLYNNSPLYARVSMYACTQICIILCYRPYKYILFVCTEMCVFTFSTLIATCTYMYIHDINDHNVTIDHVYSMHWSHVYTNNQREGKKEIVHDYNNCLTIR